MLSRPWELLRGWTFVMVSPKTLCWAYASLVCHIDLDRFHRSLWTWGSRSEVCNRTLSVQFWKWKLKKNSTLLLFWMENLGSGNNSDRLEALHDQEIPSVTIYTALQYSTKTFFTGSFRVRAWPPSILCSNVLFTQTSGPLGVGLKFPVSKCFLSFMVYCIYPIQCTVLPPDLQISGGCEVHCPKLQSTTFGAGFFVSADLYSSCNLFLPHMITLNILQQRVDQVVKMCRVWDTWPVCTHNKPRVIILMPSEKLKSGGS